MAGPPTIDERLVRYTTSAILSDGSEIVLDPFVVGQASREETDDSFSQSLHLTLVDAFTPMGESLSELLDLGVRTLHAVSYDEGATWDDQAQWDMEIMSFQPKDTNNTFQIIAYDPLQLLQGEMAKIHAFYPAGKTGEEVVRAIFAQFEIPTGKIDGPTVTMPKILFSGKAGDLLLKVLQHALAMGDKCYVPRWNGHVVNVMVPGTNDPIRVFDGTQNVVAATETRDTLDQVNKATVLGAAADDTDPARTTLPEVAEVTLAPQDETVEGIRPLTTYTDPEHAPPMKFVPKRPVKRTRATKLRNPDADKPHLAKDSAKVVVSRLSMPQITRDFTVFNADDVRKGDIVFVRAGRCNDYQTVLSVNHDLDNKVMRIKTAAKGTAVYKAQRMDVTRTALAGSGFGIASGTGIAKLQALFAWCEAHMGIPYALGTDGPDSYDCSGFTQAAFREVLGIDIGSTTAPQWSNNPPGNGAPGDLVLFGFASFGIGTGSYEHVGIVIDGPLGMMYDEPGPVSKKSSIPAMRDWNHRGIKGYRRPYDFSQDGAGTGAGASTGGPVSTERPTLTASFFAQAPILLQHAIQKYFPPEQYDNAAGISYHETIQWTDFINEVYPDKSYGSFQINELAHGGSKDFWMDTDNNVAFAAALWGKNGWCSDWFHASRKLGLCSGGIAGDV